MITTAAVAAAAINRTHSHFLIKLEVKHIFARVFFVIKVVVNYNWQQLEIAKEVGIIITIKHNNLLVVGFNINYLHFILDNSLFELKIIINTIITVAIIAIVLTHLIIALNIMAIIMAIFSNYYINYFKHFLITTLVVMLKYKLLFIITKVMECFKKLVFKQAVLQFIIINFKFEITTTTIIVIPVIGEAIQSFTMIMTMSFSLRNFHSFSIT